MSTIKFERHHPIHAGQPSNEKTPHDERGDRDDDAVPDTLPSPSPRPAGLCLTDDVSPSTRADLHALAYEASQGSTRAVAAIAIAFGPQLVAVARRELTRGSAESRDALARELVADFLGGVARGVLAGVPPDAGEGVEWLGRVLGRFARFSDDGPGG